MANASSSEVLRTSVDRVWLVAFLVAIRSARTTESDADQHGSNTLILIPWFPSGSFATAAGRRAPEMKLRVMSAC